MSDFIDNSERMIDEFSCSHKTYRVKGTDSYISCNTRFKCEKRTKTEEIVIWRVQLL